MGPTAVAAAAAAAVCGSSVFKLHVSLLEACALQQVVLPHDVKHGGCLHNFLLVLQAMREWVERRKGAKFCVH